MSTPPKRLSTRSALRRLVLRAILQAVALPFLLGLFLFIPAGTLSWPMGWAALAVHVAGTLTLSIAATLRDPALALERIHPPSDAKNWDRILTSTANALLIVVMLPISGFDQRYHWSPQLGPVAGGLSLLVVALGYAAILWAMAANPFFSSVVRIQTDRGHSVAKGGPYAFMRHPGYLAMIAQFLAMPIALGSLVACLPAILATCLYVIRTSLEDRTLTTELPGYREYAATVRYRLLPGVW